MLYSMISDKDMEHLKTLARLEISPEETQHLKQDLNKILDYFEQIKHLDTEGIEEMARPIHMENVFREDAVKPGLSHEEAMKLAIETEGGFFKVPRTVDADG
jgi:aspartyl-tRNA(Asn)/glutamyl-tRNA(Gln) amidotransferase subunit C